MIPMKMMRSPTAPSVPQTRPYHCWGLGIFPTASAMTSAPAMIGTQMARESST